MAQILTQFILNHTRLCQSVSTGLAPLQCDQLLAAPRKDRPLTARDGRYEHRQGHQQAIRSPIDNITNAQIPTITAT
jgi:hypothetical protein